MVPHVIRGEWEGDPVPSARALSAPQLPQQYRDALRGRGGPAVFAQRYCEFRHILDCIYITTIIHLRINQKKKKAQLEGVYSSVISESSGKEYLSKQKIR